MRQRVPRFRCARQIRVRYISVDVALFHLFEVVDGEEAAVGQSRARRRAAALLDLVQHGLQRRVVGRVLRHPLGHDQMIVRDGDLARIAEHELPPRWRRKRASSSVRDSFFKPLFFNRSMRRGISARA